MPQQARMRRRRVAPSLLLCSAAAAAAVGVGRGPASASALVPPRASSGVARPSAHHRGFGAAGTTSGAVLPPPPRSALRASSGEARDGGEGTQPPPQPQQPPLQKSLIDPEVLVERLIEPALAAAAAAAEEVAPPASSPSPPPPPPLPQQQEPSQAFVVSASVPATAVAADTDTATAADAGDAPPPPPAIQGPTGDSPPPSRAPERPASAAVASASASVTSTPTAPAAPTVSRIIRFAIPAMGVWLCSPVLSMIDASAVGLLAGTAQQASLSPAVAVTDYGGLLVAFMYTATTNLVAGAAGRDAEDGATLSSSGATAGPAGGTSTQRTFLSALRLGLLVGGGFGLAMGALSPVLLRALIGPTAAAASPEVFLAADRYVRIRSLGLPAAVCVGTAQSACLGMQDVRSPLYVLLAAAVVNALGDAVLVGRSHPWIGGAAGAAWATVASQYVALAMFAAWLIRPRRAVAAVRDRSPPPAARDAPPAAFVPPEAVLNPAAAAADPFAATAVALLAAEEQEAASPPPPLDISGAIWELTTKSREGKGRRERFRRKVRSLKDGARLARANGLGKLPWRPPTPPASTAAPRKPRSRPPSRGVLAGMGLRSRDLLHPPSLSAARKFSPFVVPVTVTAVGRISGYLAMSHVASSALGTVDMAAQAVVFAFFCCLTPVCDSLNLTAQSFVPALYAGRPGRERSEALRTTERNFSRVGAMFGAALVATVATIPVLSRFFTADPAVRAAVGGAVPGLAGFFALSGLVCVGEGMLLGQKDLGFLRNAYMAYFFAVPYFLLRLKHRALAGVQDVGVGTMWATFSVYQAIRCAIWYLRMKQLQRRNDKNDGAAALQ